MTNADNTNIENNNSAQNKTPDIARLEALLFVYGEPLTLKKVEKILGVEGNQLEILLHEFEKELESEKRGFALLQNSDSVQLVTKPAFGDLLLGFIKEELSEDLTTATLEALSIIAYLGPISRPRIDFLRGVNSALTLRNLRLRGLVERIPDPARQNSFLYHISTDCMKHLGITKREELPNFEKFSATLAAIEGGQEKKLATEIVRTQ